MNTTYCIFSLWNLRLIKAELFTILVCLSMAVLQFGLGDKWYIYFFPESQQMEFGQNDWLKKFGQQFVYIQISVITTFGFFNFYLIIIELNSMLCVIITQRNRPIEELLYDYENEPMQVNILEGLRKNQRVHRRVERIWYMITQVLTIILSVFSIVGSVFYYVDQIVTLYMVISLNSLYFLLLICAGLRLIYLMRKYHNYEYHRTKKQMILQLTLFATIIFVYTLIYYISIVATIKARKSLSNIDHKVQLNPQQVNRFMC